jgi:flagellar motor switch protein FliM
MTADLYDFRNPARLDGGVSKRLDTWLSEACRAADRHWAVHLPFATQCQLTKCDVVLPEDWLAGMPEAALGFQASLGEGGPQSLLILPRTLALALLAGLMGDQPQSVPEDRALTPVEEALCGYMFDHLFVHPFQTTWPGAKPLALRPGPRSNNPRETKIFPEGEGVLVWSFRVDGPFGQMEWCWMLPRSKWLLELAPAPPAGPPPELRSRLETLAREFPVDLDVTLGTAEVSLAELKRLREGDLLILDQRVCDPLTARLSGFERFRVWPGAAGSRQAVQIDSSIET